MTFGYEDVGLIVRAISFGRRQSRAYLIHVCVSTYVLSGCKRRCAPSLQCCKEFGCFSTCARTCVQIAGIVLACILATGIRQQTYQKV